MNMLMMKMMNFISALKWEINKEDLMASLTVMWQGMLGIMIVMAAISLIVFAITKFSK